MGESNRAAPVLNRTLTARYPVVIADLIFAEGACTGERPADIDDLLAIARRPEWHAEAACKGRGDLYYPEVARGAAAAELYAEARALCAGCPVAEPCREAGMGEKFGLWGGLAEHERRTARRRYRAA